MTSDTAIPICVDLDGTLTPVDTLHEQLIDAARRTPISLLAMPAWIMASKATFKSQIVARSQLDPSLLPYHAGLLEWLRNERSKGRKLVLATASNTATAHAIAQHLNIFDEVVASDDNNNLAGDKKRQALVARFGEQGFDYAGNDSVDLAVWRSARMAIVVGSTALANKARQLCPQVLVMEPIKPSVKTWLKGIRLHQWVKNLLVFLPALVSHQIFEPKILLTSLLAFIAFGLCASSVYIINDLLDLASDRKHPRKRNRPFAAGQISVAQGVACTAALLMATLLIVTQLSAWFAITLLGYYIFTWAYSLRLKRAAIVDVMTLAGLYTMRIIAGAAATNIRPSFWLLAFSIFVFLCLGIVKRYAELYDAQHADKPGGHGRGYGVADLPLLMTTGIASGYSSIIVIALYINSPDAQHLYRHIEPMWLICPLIMYWISRIWLLASRGQMDDDPVVFTIRDKISLATFALVGLIVLISI